MTLESIKTVSKNQNTSKRNYSELRVSQHHGSYKIILFLGNSKLEDGTNYFSEIQSLEEFSKTISNIQFTLLDESYALDDKGTMCDIKHILCSNKTDLLTIILDALSYLEERLTPFDTISYEGKRDFLEFDDLKKHYPKITRG